MRKYEIIRQAIETASPPLRLLLDEIAYKLAMAKADLMKANFRDWKDLTLSADFPEQID